MIIYMSWITSTTLTFLSKHHEKDDVYTFIFQPNHPVKFLAGQHGIFTLPGHHIPWRWFRPFSLASSPDDSTIQIATHLREASPFKQVLKNLQVGDTLKMYGPILWFTLKRAAPEVVFLAQGVGITPFRSLARFISAHALPFQTTLLHVDTNTPIYQIEMQQLVNQAMYASDRAEFQNKLEAIITLQPQATYYISGATPFINGTKDFLLQHGIQRQNIRYDNFKGYTK